GRGRACRRFLVTHHLQQRGLPPAEPVQCLFGEQHHREKESGWFGRHPARRVRWQDPELPADHAGVELHSTSLPPASRNPRRHVVVSVGTTRELKPVLCSSGLHLTSQAGKKGG